MKHTTTRCTAFIALTLAPIILAQSAHAQAHANNLNFKDQAYTTSTQTVDGQTMTYRAFEHIIYVKNPVDTKYQQMNIYIPEAYFNGLSVNGFDAKNAPIFLPNNVGGYMPSEPKTPGPSRDGKGADAALTALSKGYVVAIPGARGRNNEGKNGQYTGKAPAAIVDLKAAVRYLRKNDRAMPGNAEKIISNGTSAGGALSALLAASGNSKDYAPYLKAIGAANTRDDIFAASAYCPIANLEHADAAYEWQFKGVNDYKKMVMGQMIDFHVARKEVAGTLTSTEIQTANALQAQFPDYLNSLKLKDAQANSLSLDQNGNGPFKDWITAQLVKSAQKAINQGADLSKTPWVTIQNGKVTQIDFNQYVYGIQRMKTPPAFDALDLGSGENDLFGTANIKAQHFTAFGQSNSSVKSSTVADPKIVKLMNPMNYIGNGKAKTAQHWRIRHGSVDRDTSLAISGILTLKLQNNGKQVDYELPWGVPHSGDYDLAELFAWTDQLARQ